MIVGTNQQKQNHLPIIRSSSCRLRKPIVDIILSKKLNSGASVVVVVYTISFLKLKVFDMLAELLIISS